MANLRDADLVLDRHPIVSIGRLYTCTADLLRDSQAAARASHRPFTTHCSPSVSEFSEMTSRHGITQVQWTRDISILANNTILGHAIFIGQYSRLRWHTRTDLHPAEIESLIAHCPSPFARYGQTLEHFGRYRGAGASIPDQPRRKVA